MLKRLINLLPILIFLLLPLNLIKQPLIINFKQNSFHDTKNKTLFMTQKEPPLSNLCKGGFYLFSFGQKDLIDLPLRKQ